VHDGPRHLLRDQRRRALLEVREDALLATRGEGEQDRAANLRPEDPVGLEVHRAQDLEADRGGQREAQAAPVLDQAGADEFDQVVVPGALEHEALLGDRLRQVGV